MDETAPIMDCNICTEILKNLKEHRKGIELHRLDGVMRTKDVTTTKYHAKKHLEPLGLVVIAEKGTIRKKYHISITKKGAESLKKTLNKE